MISVIYDHSFSFEMYYILKNSLNFNPKKKKKFRESEQIGVLDICATNLDEFVKKFMLNI